MQATTLVSQLKQKGYRIGKARKILISHFTSKYSPITVPELITIIEKKHSILFNKTTIYRELTVLLKEKIILEIHILPNIIHYESAFTKHHHHIVCTTCNSIYDITLPFVEEALSRVSFTNTNHTKIASVDSHSLNLFGTCTQCV